MKKVIIICVFSCMRQPVTCDCLKGWLILLLVPCEWENLDYLGLLFLHSLVWDIKSHMGLFEGEDDPSSSLMWVREQCEWVNFEYLDLSSLHSIVWDIASHMWLFEGAIDPYSSPMWVREPLTYFYRNEWMLIHTLQPERETLSVASMERMCFSL